MEEFGYRARNSEGKLVKGQIVAANESAAIKNLEEKNYLPVDLWRLQKNKSFLKGLFSKVTISQINTFSRELAALLESGVPFSSALETIRNQYQKSRLREIIADLQEQVEKGASFSDALSKHRQVFGEVYVGMIRSAENVGALDEVLNKLADLGEQEEDTRAQIKSATTYPLIVVFALVVAFIVLITFVVPKFISLFGQFDTALPLPTQILIGLNKFISSFWYVLVLAVGLIIYGFKTINRTGNGKLIIDKYILRIPLIGDLLFKIILSRFSRTLSVLVHTEVPMMRALELANSSVDNSYLSASIKEIAQEVAGGENLSSAMENTMLFPPLVVQMVSSGEESGKLDDLLTFVSNYYDRKVKYSLKNLITYIEPILIFILGLVVLFIALGVFLPMWNLIKLFRG